MKISFVTGNIGKYEEVKELMKQRGVDVEHIDISKPEINSPDVKEVAEYAAKRLANELNKTVVVEDTGFYLEAYKNFPGTNSKSVFDGIGYDGFMRLLKGKSRKAFFRIVVCYCGPGKEPVSFEGRIDGTITTEAFEGGHDSMPYDPIFIPGGYDKTFSQDLKLKNKIGHRTEAFGKLADYLKTKKEKIDYNSKREERTPKISKESFWERGAFAETLGPHDVKERMKTFHNKHDEDMNFICKKCGKGISAHNKDWHACMCDKCFDEEYFPEEAQIFETDLEEIEKICKRNEKENLKFYKFLKTDELNQKRFEKIVKEIEGKIDCAKCGNCCKVLNTILTEGDTDRIAKHLNLAGNEFISKYLIKNERGDFELKQKPCIFLIDNKCKIYDARPEECREYPHLNKDVTVRGHQFLGNAEICPIVFNVLENAKEEFLEDVYAFENPDI